MRYFTVVFWQKDKPTACQYLYDNFEDADELAVFLTKAAQEGNSYQVAELILPDEALK